MALLCPNINHPDWQYAVEKLGNDKALYLFDLLNQEIPTKEQVNTALFGRYHSVSGNIFHSSEEIASQEEIVRSAWEIGGEEFVKSIEFVDDFVNNPDAVGRYYEGVASYILGRATNITAVHEPIHYFLDKLIPQEDYNFLQKAFGSEDLSETEVDERITDAAVIYYTNKDSFVGRVANIFKKFWYTITSVFNYGKKGKRIIDIFDRIGSVDKVLNQAGNLSAYYKSLQIGAIQNAIPVDLVYDETLGIITEEVPSTDPTSADYFEDYSDEYLKWYNKTYAVKPYKGTKKSKFFQKENFERDTFAHILQNVYFHVSGKRNRVNLPKNIFGKGSKIDITSTFLEHLRQNPQHSTSLEKPFSSNKATKFENKVLGDFYEEFLEGVKKFFESKGQPIPKVVKNDRLATKLKEYLDTNYGLEYYLTERGSSPYGLHNITKGNPNISGSEIFISDGLVHSEASGHNKGFINPDTKQFVGSYNSLGWYIYTEIDKDLFMYEYQSDILDEYEELLDNISKTLEGTKFSNEDGGVSIIFRDIFGNPTEYLVRKEELVDIESFYNVIVNKIMTSIEHLLDDYTKLTAGRIIDAEKYRRDDKYLTLGHLKNHIIYLKSALKTATNKLYTPNMTVAAMAIHNNKRDGIINKVINSADLYDDKDVVDLLDNLNTVGGKLFEPIMKYLYTHEDNRVLEWEYNDKFSSTVQKLIERSNGNFIATKVDTSEEESNSFDEILISTDHSDNDTIKNVNSDQLYFDYHGLRIYYATFFKVLNQLTNFKGTQNFIKNGSSQERGGSARVKGLYLELTKNFKLTQDQLKDPNIYRLYESATYVFYTKEIKKIARSKRIAEYKEYLHSINSNIFKEIEDYYKTKELSIIEDISAFIKYMMANSSLVEGAINEKVSNLYSEITGKEVTTSNLFIPDEKSKDKYENLYKIMFEKFLMHSFIMAKKDGKEVVYLPTAAAMKEIEGSKKTALIYSGPNDDHEKIGIGVKYDTGAVEINDEGYLEPIQVSKGDKQIGPFYSALSKIKGAKVLAYERPSWSKQPLLKVDITEFNPNKFERFHTPKLTREEFLQRKYARVENGMYREKSGKLVPLTPTFNPEVWWVENQEGLVNMTNVRNETLFKFRDGLAKVIELNKKYGPEFSFKSIQIVWPSAGVVRSKNPSPDNKKIYKIVVTHENAFKSESVINLNSLNEAIEENNKEVNDTLDRFNDKTIQEILDIASELGFDENIQVLLDLFNSKLNNNPGLKIIIDNEYDGTEAGNYDPTTNTITINRNPHLNQNGNLNSIGITLVHELLHSFTARAYLNNYSEQEKEFVNTINRLFSIAKKQTRLGKTAAYSEPMEWLAAVLTDPTVMREAMNMKLNLWQRIINGILKLFGVTSVYDHALKTVTEYIQTGLVFETNGVFDRKYKRSLEEIEEIENPTHKQIIDMVSGFSSQFDFDKPTHTYTHIKSGQKFNSTTELLHKLRITSGKLSEDPEVRARQIEKRTRGGNIGDIIHNIAESDLKQKAIEIAESNGYGYNQVVVDKIHQVLKQFKRPGVTILSEVIVADVDRLLAGTIDMIVIDENNMIHIYDFKSKEKGFADYLKPMSYGGSQLLTDKERHALQLSAYKDMFEKITGLTVSSINIIPFTIDVSKDNVITNIQNDKTHSANGIISLDYNYKVYQIYKYLEAKSGKSLTDEFNENRVDPETRQELDDRLKEMVKTLKDDMGKLSKREQIIIKSIKALLHKKAVLYRTGRRAEIAAQEKIIDDLIAEKDVEKQILLLVQYANKMSLRIWQEYQQYKKEGRQVPLNVLYAWRDSMSAFNAIVSEEGGLDAIISKEIGFEGGPEYRKMLQDLTRRVAAIKDLYESEGMDQLIDFLSPFYKRLYAEMRLKKTKEYRRLKFLGQISEGITEEQYVDKAIDENEEDLERRTKNLIRIELSKASRDIGVLTRWLDNVLDSQDPVTAAMVKAFVFADEDARLAILEHRNEFAGAVRELEEWYRRQGRIPNSNEEFYDFMLEKIDGKLTGHYTTSYLSTMMREYRNIVAASREAGTPDQRKAFIAAWLDTEYPLDKNRFQDAYWSFIEEQTRIGRISEQDYIRLEENRRFKNKLNVGEMLEKGIISFETSDILDTWLSENTWNYRVPALQWRNPQYDKLQKILDDPNDPRGKFYKMIVKSRLQADHFLPFGFRLDSRLPGVIKQNHERIDSGQGIASTIKGALSRELTFKIDDTHRIHEEIVDESNNAKYFLPIHFTGRVTKEVTKLSSDGEEYITREFDEDEQSFDLATIYHKYWAMAKDYNVKAQILPQMELAKFMINKRTAIKHDSLGNTILKKGIKKGKGNTPEDEMEESEINNTLLAQQVNDWFLTCVYGVQENDAGKWGNIDLGKLLNAINSYTSLNLLGLNVVAGTANVILGETLQRIESFAGEYMSPGDFLYADKFHFRNMKGMIGDIGARSKDSLGINLVESFGVLDDYGRADMDRRTKLGQLMTMDTLYATSHLGEHYMQSRFLFGMLANKRAYDINGKDIGRMLDMYEMKDGKLSIKPEVSLEKSKWTELDQKEFKMKVRGILSRLHGEYSQLGRIAIQRMAIGRMAYLFRHFIVTGFRRRWAKNAYYERLGHFAEGNYITTMKFLGVTGGKIFGKTEANKDLQFFDRLISNLQSFKLSMFGEEWAALTDHEKANVHRTLYEVGFLILAMILANIAVKFEGDDDDDEAAKAYWAFVAYQSYRLQNELMFFTPKLDSAMSIMRSPAASFSFVENIIDLSGQIFHPTEVYESGPWKGRPKIMKTLNNMTPGLRQYYRFKDIQDQIPWMQKASLSGRPRDDEDKYTIPVTPPIEL